jgi:uncharacterized protein (DUF2141 family)
MKLVLTLLAGFGLLPAQQQPTSQPTSPQDKCSLEGKAVNLVTGQPVRKVRLTLSVVNPPSPSDVGLQPQAQQPPLESPQAPPPAVVSTDAQGKFAFPNLEPGAYRLSARHDNYSNQQYGAKKPGQPGEPILLAPGTKKTDLELRLTPYATIAGRIRDEDGDPMQQAPVAVMAYEYTSSGRQLTERSTAATNDLGEYRLFNLAPGKYYLLVSPTPMRGIRYSDADEEEDSFIAVYYPNSPDPSGASPVELTPGQQLTSIDFTLRRTHAPTISGRIVKPTGGTGLSIALKFEAGGGTSSYSTSIAIHDADGKFEIRGVSAGAYFLYGFCSVGDRRYSATLPIQVGGADIDKLELHLAAPTDVTGRVRIEGETPVKLTQVLVHMEGRVSSPGSGGTVMEDGAFEFRSVEPDVFHVNVSVPGELYLKSVSWGSKDVTESGIDLSAGAPNADLEIVVSANGGQIDGKVENDKSEPVDDALVTLVPPGARRNRTFFKSVRTTPDGHFTITGVAPGTYKLYAWDDVEVNAVLYDPDFLRPFETAGQSIQITEGARQAGNLKLIVKPPE